MRAYYLFDSHLRSMRPDSILEILEIYVPIRAIGKQRPRSEHSTPIKTRMWTDYFAECVAEQMGDKPAINFPVKAAVVFGLSGNRLPDTDNIEKALWDALQRGNKSGKQRALEDDRFVRGHIEKCEISVAKGCEFIWVRFYANTEEQAEAYEYGYD